MTGFTLLKEVVPTLFLSIDPSASSFRDKLARMVQKQGQILEARARLQHSPASKTGCNKRTNPTRSDQCIVVRLTASPSHCFVSYNRTIHI